MAELHTASTIALSPTLLRDIRTLLDDAFVGNFSDHDWDHALGGTHVWIAGPDGVISHGSLVQRELEFSGRLLGVGYVEAVATSTAHRRQGHGSRVMKQIGELIRQQYVLGALSTETHAFYETLGWERWRGPTHVDASGGRQRTPGDDGDIMILRTALSPDLDLDQDIVCDWRSGDVW